MADLSSLNAWERSRVHEAFCRCCGSDRWAARMADARPYEDERDLLEHAEEVWWALEPVDWLQAFSRHPRIGGRDALREKFAATAAWSKGEQGKVAGASEETLAALERGNREYEERFGHIFIVCATGKSAEEILALLRARLAGTPEDELRAAAAEQAKITRIRLEKLLKEPE